MGKKCETVNLLFTLVLFFFVLIIIYSIPNREELSLLAGSAPLTPVVSKMSIDIIKTFIKKFMRICRL